jgi:hypothetical protein
MTDALGSVFIAMAREFASATAVDVDVSRDAVGAVVYPAIKLALSAGAVVAIGVRF